MGMSRTWSTPARKGAWLPAVAIRTRPDSAPCWQNNASRTRATLERGGGRTVCLGADQAVQFVDINRFCQVRIEP